MKNFLNNNKIILTNLLLIALIVISYFLKGPKYEQLKIYLKAMGCLGLTCSIINWFALEIILDKISFLYNIDKIRDFMQPIRIFLINDIFGSKDFGELKNKYETILTDEDKKRIEESFSSLNINNIIKAFNSSDAIKSNIKQNILTKIFEIEDAIKIKLSNGLSEEDMAKSPQQLFKEDILPIIENKLEMSVLTRTQSTIYQTVKNYLAWLVLWGAYCGAAFGLVFRFIGCL